MSIPRNPYDNTPKRRAALAWMRAHGIEHVKCPVGIRVVSRPAPRNNVVHLPRRIPRS